MCSEYERDAGDGGACTRKHPVSVDDLAARGDFLGYDFSERGTGSYAVGKDPERVVGAEAPAKEAGTDASGMEISGDIAVANHEEANIEAAVAQCASERPDEPASLAVTGGRAECQQEDLHYSSDGGGRNRSNSRCSSRMPAMSSPTKPKPKRTTPQMTIVSTRLSSGRKP